MAAAWEGAEQRRRALIGDGAHELRPPLATIASYLEGMLEMEWVSLMTHPGHSCVTTCIVCADEPTIGTMDRAANHTRWDDTWNREHRSIEIEAAFACLKRQCSTKGIALSVPGPPHLPLVLADRHRIVQVLVHGLGHALHDPPPGGPVMMKADTTGDAVRFCIRDTGIGSDAEHRPHRFRISSSAAIASIPRAHGQPAAAGSVSPSARRWEHGRAGTSERPTVPTEAHGLVGVLHRATAEPGPALPRPVPAHTVLGADAASGRRVPLGHPQAQRCGLRCAGIRPVPDAGGTTPRQVCAPRTQHGTDLTRRAP
jgi:hypothetical protein